MQRSTSTRLSHAFLACVIGLGASGCLGGQGGAPVSRRAGVGGGSMPGGSAGSATSTASPKGGAQTTGGAGGGAVGGMPGGDSGTSKGSGGSTSTGSKDSGVATSSPGGGVFGDPSHSAKAAGLLTLAQVQRAAGRSDLRMVPLGGVEGALGQANYATADGKLVLAIMVGPTALYDSMQKSGSSQAADGIGDAALVGPKGPMQFILVFKKGDTAVWMSTGLDVSAGLPKVVLPMSRMRELAKLAADKV